MKKIIKILLITLTGVIVIISALGLGGYLYIKSFLFDFDNNNYGEIKVKSITNDKGLTFNDYNNNNFLDTYEDNSKSLEERVSDLLSKMTNEEKIAILKGTGIGSMLGFNSNGVPGAAGEIYGNKRFGLSKLYLADGPAGLRISSKRKKSDKKLYSTAFPVGSLIASTWDKNLAFEIGKAMGSEAKSYGVDIILAPGMNLHRNPLCGRNFEYFSEDPVLSGNIAAGIVNGIQKNNVGACPKHFVVNNQETDRMKNNAQVDERTLREIYLKGFEIMVKKSQPWAIMSSYNKLNGKYVTVNKRLLTSILREEWGFKGTVMTDWFGGGDTVKSIKAGNDLIEPGTSKVLKDLEMGLKNQKLNDNDLNIAASRILKLILRSNKMNNSKNDNSPDLKYHAEIVREKASEGMILLKNDGTLPLKENHIISLIGVTSFNIISGGIGSGDVDEAYTVNIDEALLKSNFKLNKTSTDLYKNYFEKNPVKKPEGIIENLMLMMNPKLLSEINYTDNDLNTMAENSDLAVLTIGRNSGEGKDRVEKNDFLLSKKEKELIEKICEVFHSKNKKVVVVLNIGGVIETDSWKDLPDAILLAWQAGQESGNSIVDILSGKVNPSGKLPMTFPVALNDHRSTKNFPTDGTASDMTLMFDKKEKPLSEQTKNKDFTIYEEGLYVGYRHFEKEDINTSYPFGYGLSYTNFDYSNIVAKNVNDTINISLDVKNTGNISGKEIVQIYFSKSNSSVDRPKKELKDFSKTKLLKSGEKAKVEFSLPISDLSYWDDEKNEWVIEKGNYEIFAGSSSSDIRLHLKNLNL
ncbi:beta-glucosidase [Flavobacteriaceae bacterium]|nr:beta-glucosidase [Flavobacteriaceae bacterium]